MTIRSHRQSHAFCLGLLLTLALLPIANAVAQKSAIPQKAYWCKHDNGAVYAQLEPCAPGMETGTGEITNGLITSAPVEGTVNTSPPPEAVVVKPSEPVESVAPEVTTRSDDEAMKQGRLALLKLLGFGLVFGAVAKMLGRSFWLGALIGVILRFALVSLDLMKF